ncbi:unnamed protein product [Fructobacillus cardui]|nr:unnamed protein product [Fructobacillus cardui]
MYERFKPDRQYTQRQVMKELGIKSNETFRRNYKNKKGFPKPIHGGKTHPVWDGLSLRNYFFKQSNRYA